MSIRNTYVQITRLENLFPNDEVNSLFSELVKLSLDDQLTHDLSENEISQIQKLSSQSEYLMEVYWANKIINSDDPVNELKNFWYYDNYVDLTRMEWNGLISCNPDIHEKQVLFIGSGPLPLTAILLARDYDCNITLLDIESEAIELSKKLITALGLIDKFSFIKADASVFHGYSDFNVIFVAALAGIDNHTKDQIVLNINNNASIDSNILMRSSYANRKILYKPISENIFKILKPIMEIRPYNEVVNSVLIFKPNIL